MKKVLIIISDNNKSKFISRGFANAFKKLSFFVYEMKTYDLNIKKINSISPDLIFIFWSDLDNNFLDGILSDEISCKTEFVHCSDYLDNIPKKFHKKKFHHIFSPTSKNKYIQPVSGDDYKTVFSGFKYGITFSGNPSYENREIILSQLIKNFGKINIFARSFDFYKSIDEISNKKLLDDYELELYRKSYNGYVNSTNELKNIYVSSLINIDIENKFKKDINYRLLEITASGGFVIAPYNQTVVNQFDDGKEIETYKNIDELIDKIKFYSKNQSISKIIALNGKTNTISNFSYYDKLKEMLKVVYGKNFSSR